MSLQEYFHELAEGDNALSHTNLTQLSGLAGNELRSLEGEWPFIPADRRQRLVDRLVDMAEGDVDLDFTGVLRQCLQDDDPGVRDKAVNGLWECDDRTLITPFIQLMSSDPEERVRASAAISLGKFSTLAVFGKLLPKDRDRTVSAPVRGIYPIRQPEREFACRIARADQNPGSHAQFPSPGRFESERGGRYYPYRVSGSYSKTGMPAETQGRC